MEVFDGKRPPDSQVCPFQQGVGKLILQDLESLAFPSFTVREMMIFKIVFKGKEGRKYIGHAEIVLLLYQNVTIRNDCVWYKHGEMRCSLL